MTVYPVSVIVCTHNRAALLPRVITQLCAQDYPKDSFEIIIVDNASTDDTLQTIQRFIPTCGLTLHYVRENRPGVTFARNRGAEEAHYPYLAYLDDDCTVGRDWLSQLVSGFGLDNHVSVVGGCVALAFDDQKTPAWLGPVSKRWLAEFNFPGSHPRVLDDPTYVCEGNMAIKKQAWQSVGGFLGMDQFNSPHVAAQEIVYLLEQIKRQGGRVAFVPNAIANHHTVLPTRKQMLMRAYFHGVSSGVLDYLLKGFSWVFVIFHAILDAAAACTFLCLSFLFFLVFNQAAFMDHLLRAAMRFGKVLSELRLAGDWRGARRWKSALARDSQRKKPFMKIKKSIFIVWKQYQRRVEVMAPYLETEYFYFYHSWEMKSKFLKALSYIPKTINTLRCLFKNRPTLVFLQFPPAPALYSVALYAWLTGAGYVSDCHFGLANAQWLRWPFVKKLLTKGQVVVHNEHLVKQVEESVGITPFVVRDGIAKKQAEDRGKNNLLDTLGLSPKTYVIFPCSFSADEPLEEVFEAARSLPAIPFVMTWHAEKLARRMQKTLPTNALLTGFLKVGDFNQLFANAGVALVLTKHEAVQLSGMQEAMAFEIPAVVTDLKTTRFLYKDSPVYVKNDSESIAQGITHAFQNRSKFEEKIKKLRIESEKEFCDQVANLKSSLKARG